MNRDVIRQIVNIATFAMTVIVNGLANGLPLNNLTTGEISDSIPILFVPAGYVFAIWGLIYLALTGFVVYQALPSQRENPRLRRIGYWFALSNVANTVWIFLWHYLVFPATLVAMLVVLISLVVIYERLAIGRRGVSRAERWLVNFPFSVYLGWITVATVANVSVVLYEAGWDGLGIDAAIWAAALLVIATVITGLVIVRRGDVAYAGVIIWAFAGIVVKQSDTQLVAATAAVMAVVVGLLLISKWFIDRQGGAPSTPTQRQVGANA
jgi:translocator protein